MAQGLHFDNSTSEEGTMEMSKRQRRVMAAVLAYYKERLAGALSHSVEMYLHVRNLDGATWSHVINDAYMGMKQARQAEEVVQVFIRDWSLKGVRPVRRPSKEDELWVLRMMIDEIDELLRAYPENRQRFSKQYVDQRISARVYFAGQVERLGGTVEEPEGVDLKALLTEVMV